MNGYKCENCIYGDLSVDDFPCDACYNGSMYEPKESLLSLPKTQLSHESTTSKQPEPKEGHWILHETPDGGEQYECSRCGVLWEFNDGTPEDNEAFYCPKCGTKMDGEQDGH